MGRRTILYRGSLKSCNYRCSYCPFSKHRASASGLDRDRGQLERFCESMERRAQELSVGAVFIVPYGEASIHSWYWEGLGRLARIPEIDRVGIQTNLSFSVEKALAIYDSASGRVCGDDTGGKLSIWATFHPEMTDVDTFVAKCHRLTLSGVMLCAGAVGVPGNLPLLGQLREKLSPRIYLWINQMDGLGRNYTAKEREAFARLDPFFGQELLNPAADAAMCKDRCFVEADGRIHTCNISRTKEVNWYEGSEEEIFRPLCSRKRCTCYLAYGGRADFGGKHIFGDYPIFRIPKRFQAVFLDLDGTLMPEGDRGRSGGLPGQIREKLLALREISPVFLATSMPEEEVRKRIGKDMDLFQGGVYASGGYVCVKGKEKESGCCKEAVYQVDIGNGAEVIDFARETKARIKEYRKNDTVYKVTLIKRQNAVWSSKECQKAKELLAQADCRAFAERHCLEIVQKGRDKGTGIREICNWLRIPVGEVLAAGNDREDEAMKRVCGAYVSVRGERVTS